MHRYSRAFTLTELAIVLTIVGIVISGIWSYSATSSEKVRLQRAADFIHSTVITFDNFLATSGGGGSAFALPPSSGCPSANTNEITKAAMIAGIFSEDKGLLPSDWTNPLSATPLKSPWGSPATIQLYTNTYDGCSATAHTVAIRFIGGIPPSSCVQLIIDDLDGLLSLGLFSMTIGNTTEYFGITPGNYATISANYFPFNGVTVHNIGAICAAINGLFNIPNSQVGVTLEFVYPSPAIQ